MSNITIIKDDNTVYVDGGALSGLDLSSANIPDNVHALQWKSNLGWIEFKENSDFTKPQNQVINELPAWATNCVNMFNAKLAANQAVVANAANNQPQTTGTTVI